MSYHRKTMAYELGDDAQAQAEAAAKTSALQQIGAAFANLLTAGKQPSPAPFVPGVVPISTGPSLTTIALVGGAAVIGGYLLLRRRKP